jgi:hypothetical protein
MGNTSGKEIDDEYVVVDYNGPGNTTETPTKLFQDETLQDHEVPEAEPAVDSDEAPSGFVLVPNGVPCFTGEMVLGPVEYCQPMETTEDLLRDPLKIVPSQDVAAAIPDVTDGYELVEEPTCDDKYHRLRPYSRTVHFGCQTTPDFWMSVDPDSEHPFVKHVLSRHNEEMRKRVRMVWKYLQNTQDHFQDFVFSTNMLFHFNVYYQGQAPVPYIGTVDSDNTVRIKIWR